MGSSFPPAPHPAVLPPGTVVGNWRVEAWAGRGVYGTVYRAVPLHARHAFPVALKLALHPEDPRFAREVHLLSLFEHPSIPRLLDHGAWQGPGGLRHPFLVMEWVDGVRLYDHARLHPPSSLQVLRWLSQLADALTELEAREVVHRDVKGGNVLVRRTDGRAMLMDFGTGIYPGAAMLTPPLWFPGTPAYRSPESWLFELQFSRDASARYRPAPADDLYALGVTACRLLTGEDPELGAPLRDEHGRWHLEAVIPPLALLGGPQVEPALRDMTLRLLSVDSEKRGSAAQWARSLEHVARHVEQEGSSLRAALPDSLPVPLAAEQPAEAPALKPHEEAPPKEAPGLLAEEPSGASVPAERFRHRERTWRGWPWLALAAAGLAVVLWARPDPRDVLPEEPALAQAAGSEEDAQDAETRGLGEAAAATALEQAPAASLREKLAKEPLPEPQPGQLRPNAKGQCPHKRQTALNKGCWLGTSLDREGCTQINGQMHKGICYVPIILPGRPPTSSPTDKP
jgi:eukaryotic-like serine/threonine-protein kinase